MRHQVEYIGGTSSLPSRERELKQKSKEKCRPYSGSLPSRERELKQAQQVEAQIAKSRSPRGSVN